MHWINSTGGPFICCDSALAKDWLGVFGSSVPESKRNDYERACEVTGYVDLVEIGSEGVGLVLGDEPNQSAFVKLGNGELSILRWVYADSREGVEALLTQFANAVEAAPSLKVAFHTGKILMFDASIERPEDVPSEESDGTPIEPGTYDITTEALTNDHTSLMLHRFRKNTA